VTDLCEGDRQWRCVGCAAHLHLDGLLDDLTRCTTTDRSDSVTQQWQIDQTVMTQVIQQYHTCDTRTAYQWHSNDVGVIQQWHSNGMTVIQQRLDWHSSDTTVTH